VPRTLHISSVISGAFIRREMSFNIPIIEIHTCQETPTGDQSCSNGCDLTTSCQSSYSSPSDSSCSTESINTPNRINLVKSSADEARKHRHKMRLLGRGSFGSVFSAKANGKKIACKVISRKPFGEIDTNSQNNQTAKSTTRCTCDNIGPKELLLTKLNHRCLVRLISVTIDPQSNNELVTMQFGGTRTVQSLLDNHDIAIGFNEKLRLIKELASALQYCHAHSVLHLDVKPSNILVDSKGKSRLADFGSCRHSDDSSNSCPIHSHPGTVPYCAPELFKSYAPTTKSDVYSFGICVWQISTRRVPYNGLEHQSIIFKVVSQNFRPNMIAPASGEGTEVYYYQSEMHYSKFEKLSIKCWNANPIGRPDMDVILREISEIFE